MMERIQQQMGKLAMPSPVNCPSLSIFHIRGISINTALL